MDVSTAAATSGKGLVYLFTGREYDCLDGADSNYLKLQYSRARYYNFWLRRWLQRDPAGYWDGMSLYEYVGSRSVVFLDPRGLATSVWVPKKDSGVMTESEPWRDPAEPYQMEYSYRLRARCVNMIPHVESATVTSSNLKDDLDSIGISVLAVGVTVSDRVDITTQTSPEDCPEGYDGKMMRVKVIAKWIYRKSVGLNPGVGPLSWDLGWSWGHEVTKGTQTTTYLVSCCCKKKKNG